MSIIDKESETFNKEHFVKPRIVFDEWFEKQVAAGIPTTRLEKYMEKLKAGKYGKCTRFVLNHKYAFSYGIVGILIFGFIIGLICVSFGWFVDAALNRRIAFNQEMSEKDELYKKYRHTFVMKNYSLFIESVYFFVIVTFGLYSLSISILSEISTLDPILKSWYRLTDPLTLKMAILIPAINSYGEYLSHTGYYKLIWQVRHVMAVSWFIALLPLPLFINYCLYLIKHFNSWSYNMEQHKIGLLKQLYGLIVSFIFFLALFNMFFLGSDYFGEDWMLMSNKPFAASICSLGCIGMFMATCLWLGTIIKVNKEYILRF